MSTDNYRLARQDGKGSSRAMRELSIPSKELAKEQRHILETILVPNQDLYTSKFVHSYLPDCNQCTCAVPHCNSEWVVGIDLLSFFNHVSKLEVYHLFRQITGDSLASFMHTDSTTHNGVLPIGACTSPALSNMVFSPIDIDIAERCANYSFTYTRYCDDLIFSTKEPYSEGKVNAIIAGIVSRITVHGYAINRAKTRVTNRRTRQTVCNLVVNGDVPRVPRNIRRDFTSRVVELVHLDKSLWQAKERKEYVRLIGLLGYIKSVDPISYNQLKEYEKWLITLK